MTEFHCDNAVSARINYSYPGHGDDPAWNGLIVSNSPPVTITSFQPSQATVDCGIYGFTVVIPQVTWSLPNQEGIQSAKETRVFGAYAFGPIDPELVSVVGHPAVGSYYGITQEVVMTSRGPFNGYETCGVPRVHKPVDYVGGGLIPGSPPGSTGQNAFYPLFDVENVRIEGIFRIDGPLDPPSCIFSVNDATGRIYTRTEAICPSFSVSCEGECGPGLSRIGGCCIDCSDLHANLRAIRSAVRRL